MPTVALLTSATKTRNSSIMEADPAIMEAGKNAHPTGVNNYNNGDNDGGGKAVNIVSKAKSNSTLINKMKNRSLKMRGLKTKTFFRTDRSFTASSAAVASKIAILSSDSAAKRAADSTAEGALASQSTLKKIDSNSDLSTSKSDSSSTTIDEDIDSFSSSPSSGEVCSTFDAFDWIMDMICQKSLITHTHGDG